MEPDWLIKIIVMPNHQPKKEGTLASILEEGTSRIPSDVYLWSAASMFAASLACFIGGKKHTGVMLGLTVPSLLIIGVYNKIVKIEGHDEVDKKRKEHHRKTASSPSYT
jgi:hypothetical protein